MSRHFFVAGGLQDLQRTGSEQSALLRHFLSVNGGGLKKWPCQIFQMMFFFFCIFCCVWGFIFLWLLARSRCCQFSLSSGCSVWTFFSLSLCWCETVYIVSHHKTMFVYVCLFMQHSLALKTQETDHNFEVIGLCHFHFAQGMLRLWHWSHFPEL